MKGRQKLVLDSSVVVKFILAEGERDLDKADLILERAAEGKIEMVAPVLVKYEVGNAIKKRKFLDREKRECWNKLSLIPIRYLGLDFEQGIRAWEVAEEASITFYDAVFIELAERLGVKLVTANPRHHKKMDRVEVVELKDY